ncbi:MAG: hypothetical protein R3D26_20265 [Cyanobacteriota/Melainabacteria group bacterium]
MLKVDRINKKSRARRGNMLILITAAIVGIMIGLLIFGLGFVRLLGTSQEQRTAIEAAALAAARDCTRICIPTAEVGWVSLSDYVPNGSRTTAPDGYALPVRSINSLIGTARIDLIIADRLDEDIMRELSRVDLQDTLSAKDQLVTALRAAIAPGGSGQDKDGNTVRPYQSAENAYKQNQIRMTGNSNYVANSLTLSLGSLTDGTATNIPVPEPQAMAPVPSNSKIGNNYKSYVNIPVTAGGVTTRFMFGGIGNTIKIVDHKKWVATLPSAPYDFPTIIRAEAQQLIKDVQHPNGERVRAVACAQPASVFDPLPRPGALSISLPDGPIPELNKPGDIYLNPKMNDPGTDPADLLTAEVGDYPLDAGSRMTNLVWPLDSSNSMHPTADIWRVALHDWIRRAGTKANISSAVNMETLALAAPSPASINWVAPLVQGGAPQNLGTIPAGIIHIYKWQPNGTISYQYRPLTPYPVYVSSHRQLYSETMVALDKSSSGKFTVSIALPSDPTNPKDVVFEDDWDAYIRDEVRNRGVVSRPTPSPPTPYNTYGGKHAGEPLGKPAVAFLRTDQSRLIADNDQKGGKLIARDLNYYGYGASAGKGKGKGKGTSGVQGSDTGFPPFVAPQDDFADGMVPAPPMVPPLPSGQPMRPTYMTTGTAVDFKLRRQIDVEKLNGALGNTGYVGEVGVQLP